MRSKQKNSKVPADRVVKYIRRARRKPYSAEEKDQDRAGRPAR